MRFDLLAIVLLALLVLAVAGMIYAFVRAQRAIAARVKPSDRLRVYGSQVALVIAGVATVALVVLLTR